MQLTPNQAENIAAKLAELYVSERNRYVIMRSGRIFIPKDKERYIWLTNKSLVKHVMQGYAISVFGTEIGSRFLCFDVDAGGLAAVKALCRAIYSAGIDWNDIHISDSGSKGYHVELFFDEIVAHVHLLRFFRAIMEGVATDTSHIECRPSRNTSIKLPLSTHQKTGRMCWFLDRESLKPIESFEYVFGIRPMDAKHFVAIADTLGQEIPEVNDQAEKAFQEYQNGEGITISNVHLPKLEKAGTRHNLTVKLAVALRYRGIPMDACVEILLYWIAKQDHGLYHSSSREVFMDTRQIVRWTYQKAYMKVAGSVDEVAISRADMQRVMTQGNKTLRKLYFLLLLNRSYWKPLRQDDLGIMLGVSTTLVERYIMRLTAAGELIKDPGEVKRTRAGYLVKKRMRYDIDRRALTKQQEAEWPTELYFHSFPLPETPEAFVEVYYGAILAMFGTLDLQRRMTPVEYKDYLCYVERSTSNETKEAHHGKCETGNQEPGARVEGMGLSLPGRTANSQEADTASVQAGHNVCGIAGHGFALGRNGDGSSG